MNHGDQRPVSEPAWREPAARYVLNVVDRLTGPQRLDIESARFALSVLPAARVGRLSAETRARLRAAVHQCELPAGGFCLSVGSPASLHATYYGLLCCEMLGEPAWYGRPHRAFVLSRLQAEGFRETDEETPSVDAIYYGARALEILRASDDLTLTDILPLYALPSGGYRLRRGEPADLDPTYEAIVLQPNRARTVDAAFIARCRQRRGYSRRPEARSSLAATFWAVRTLGLLGAGIDCSLRDEVLAAQHESGGFRPDWWASEPTPWATYAAAATLDQLESA